MSNEPAMTLEHARRVRRIFYVSTGLVVTTVAGLIIFSAIHPSRNTGLILLLAMVIMPGVLSFLLRKSRIGAFFNSGAVRNPNDLRSALLQHPLLLVTFPLILAAISWSILLATIGAKPEADRKAWLTEHGVTVVLWVMGPQLLIAYLCVVLHAPYMGFYIAGCVAYVTVTSAVGGLSLENGVVGFFGKYKAQASPLIILSYALICAGSYAVLHFATWSKWPSEYVNMHGFEDALYFSVVTMATVGYGDILPIGHLARWLCIFEIISGFLLLVVGVSASMSIWLQKNQPKEGVTVLSSKLAQGEQVDKTAEPLTGG